MNPKLIPNSMLWITHNPQETGPCIGSVNKVIWPTICLDSWIISTPRCLKCGAVLVPLKILMGNRQTWYGVILCVSTRSSQNFQVQCLKHLNNWPKYEIWPSKRQVISSRVSQKADRYREFASDQTVTLKAFLVRYKICSVVVKLDFYQWYPNFRMKCMCWSRTS